MPNRPPWKLATIGGVAVVAGVALLLADWTLPQLAAFVAMFFVARGALHIVTTSFEGVRGALAALQGIGELCVGLTLLVWPSPTLLVVAAVAGVWVIFRGIVDTAITMATRNERPRWPVHLVASLIEIVLGITLIIRVGGSAEATAVTLGILAVAVGLLELLDAVGGWRNNRHRPTAENRQSIAAVS